MSFITNKERVGERDTVILCRGYEKMYPVQVERGKVLQIKGGAVHHDALIGKLYGSKVETSNGKNWVLVLQPTPELWTQCLPHRTQIIYPTDAALIALLLGLRPGSKVIEAGTGSGGLSHALARSIAPHGHLYTFEFHQQRADIAREEFERHGLMEVVTVACRDVCAAGFGLEGVADAVFLDLPKPWEAIAAAASSVKSGGVLCTFSPCMEQVQRTCECLKASHFSGVEVMECLLRPYMVKLSNLAVPNVGVVPDEGVAASAESRPGESGDGGISAGLGFHSLWTTCPVSKIPGHTGYLTSATLY